MRKISSRCPDHNPARILAWATLGILLAVTSGGCQGHRTDDPAKAAGTVHTDCQVVINSQPWLAFKAMAGRMSQGQTVPDDTLTAFGERPTVAAWRRSLAPNIPHPIMVAEWLRNPWRKKLGLPPSRKSNGDMRAMTHSYLYSFGHAAAIDSLLQRFTAGPDACATSALVRKWIRPANIPDPLVINFLPAMPEIRIHEQQIYLDTGLLLAGGSDQTIHSIATLLYRKLETVPGTNPLEAEGEQAVAECLRTMANEGISGWIQQTTSIYFRPDHPSLHKVKIVPSDFYFKAQQTMARFGDYLPPMFADPAVMTEQGNSFARKMAGGNSFTQTGVAMAEVIVNNLGEDRLLQTRGSVPDFWAAYQEAAGRNETPLPVIGAPHVPLYKSMAPLPDTLYEPIMALLKRQFPAE